MRGKDEFTEKLKRLKRLAEEAGDELSFLPCTFDVLDSWVLYYEDYDRWVLENSNWYDVVERGIYERGRVTLPRVTSRPWWSIE